MSLKIKIAAFTTIATLVLHSCANDETMLPISEESEIFLKYRSLDDAIQIASSVAKSKNVTSRSYLPCIKDVRIISNTNVSRASSADTLMYAVNFQNDNGFVLVAAPQSVEPIIAITDNGNFGSSETENNENFQYSLELAKEYIISSSSAKLDTIKRVVLHPNETIYCDKRVEKRIQLELDQQWPEGMFCPNKIAGCVPIAIAQICSYFENPTIVTLDYSDKDQNYSNLVWSDITKHTNSLKIKDPSESVISSHFSACQATESQHYQLARFIRQIGKYGNASYDDNTTSMTNTKAFKTLKNYLNSKTFTEKSSSQDVVNSIISYDGVAYISGSRYKQDGTEASHAWVADGTIKIGYTVKTYSVIPVGSNDYDNYEIVDNLAVTTYNYISSYLHLNWGWGGNCNGYFLSSIFDTSDGYQYDHTYGNSTSYNYDHNFTYLFIR